MRKILLVFLFLSCRYRELPEELFIYPIREGTIWYYEEEGVGALDSLIVLRDTNYTFSGKVLPAWKVQKSHVSASQGFIIDTHITFIYNNTIMEVLPTKGLFPDSIYYNDNWVKFIYNEDSVVVTWLSLKVKPGDKWEMARGSGRVMYGSLACDMSITVDAEAVGYEDIKYRPITRRFLEDSVIYRGDSLFLERSLKVEYKVKTTMCSIPLEVTLLTIWWKSGIGPVKNEALAYPNNLITYLVGWIRP
ncbi:MAG: hypothetical protein ACO2O5_13665 [Candidatus Caldipriscus sp.]